MPVVVQKGAPKLLTPARLTPESIRDLLLSLPDSERRFIISDPLPGQHRILSIRRNISGNLEYVFEE